MKNRILEVQNYFINKITACEFTVKEIIAGSDWTRIKVDVEGYSFNLSINPALTLICVHDDSFMVLEIPNDRLSNILQLIKSKEQEAKKQKIEKLKAELEKLQTA
ncbi:hypothetical protein [Chryseobacterium lathyri]|uniref:Uncharacterized protein n=1 Tax=Chryseobacterium lathyri TaxID=395933 RepID=A0A511YFZ8_9FLAO|nr:hypothetical protein [Chryseobacterium lathyri]GEN74118.1 hypothetical protein CLA01_41900 [Chryseobacterium lathyri]